MKKIKSSFVSRGLGAGKVILYKPYVPKINKILNISVDQAINKLNEVFDESLNDLNKLYNLLDENFHEEALIISSHIEIINDLIVKEEIINLIKNGFDLSYAIYTTYQKYISVLSNSNDDYLRQRIEDFNDVMIRLLKQLEDYKDINFNEINENIIVVAYDLLPSQIANFNLNNVKGFVTELGGPTSHSIILARSFNIPAVVGLKNTLDYFNENDYVILNSHDEVIIINPDNKALEEYENKEAENVLKQKSLLVYENKEAITKDNKKINIFLNLNYLNINNNINDVVDGVGLYRSEFLFMNRKKAPSVTEQVEVYNSILSTFKNKPVTIRTLDIGADKIVDYLKVAKEDNPILGIRGIRLSFQYIELFKEQIKALLMANYNNGNLSVMFPMISSVDDIIQVKSLVNDVEQSLKESNINYQSFKFGIMIEVPSVVFILDKIIPLIDFASIGSNDLTQYMLAVDRLNPLVKNYDQIYAPSVINAIYQTVKTFNEHNKPISLCGELAGDSKVTQLLLGMGLQNFSMSRSQIGLVKKVIINSNNIDSKKLLDNVLELSTHSQINNYLIEYNKS